MENQNEKSSLSFYDIKGKVLDEISEHAEYVPYDVIKVLIMTNFTSPHWWHRSTYGIKHDIERAYTISQNNGRRYYCANNWVKCAIWDLNMYDRYKVCGHHNYYDIKDYFKNDVVTPETILDNSINWYIKVHTSKYTPPIEKYLRG